MKNIFNFVIVAFAALALTFGTTSCKKPSDDPTPSVPSDTTKTNPNPKDTTKNSNPSAPTVTAKATPSSAVTPATVVLSATATPVGNATISKVIFVKSGSSIPEYEDVSAPYEYILSSLPVGDYTYSVIAIDSKSLSDTAIVTFKVNANGGSNHAPTFTSTSMRIASNGSAQVFALPVSDSDNNTVTITSITGASSNVTITYSGLNVTVTPKNTVFAGSETLSIEVSDGTTSTTSNFTVNVGETAQIDTYGTLSTYFTKTLSGNFKLLANGTISGGGDADFYESASTSATYKILANGNIQLIVAGVTIEYSMTYPDANHIIFTLESTTNASYSSYVGNATFTF